MSTMSKVNNIFKSIADTSSKKDKEAIIKQNDDNELFLMVLNHLYNPYVKTNIAKKKLAKDVSGKKADLILDDIEFIAYLQRCKGNDENITSVQKYIGSQDEELKWLLEGMAMKNLKVGITGVTINKALGKNFIPSFEVMLSEKFIDVKKDGKVVENWKHFENEDVIVTKKLDGYRAVIVNRGDGDVKIYSREGNLYEDCIELEEAFKDFPTAVYDGEILAINTDGLDSNELFKKTQSAMKKKGVKRGVEFQAFDMLSLEGFELGQFDISAFTRKKCLEGLVNKFNNPLIQYVKPLYAGVFDMDIVMSISDEARKNKEEGIMVQLADAQYSFKRTKDIQKVKVFHSADVECVGVYEGLSGKNVGKLGGIIVDFKGNCVKVGIGLSDEDREKFWKDKDLIVGKIVEIKYFEEFTDEESGNLDLRFSSFKTIREDKSEPSYN